MASYPRWAFYPARDKPPEWVSDFVGIVSTARTSIDTAKVPGLTSDAVLARLRPGLEGIGFRIEAGKKAADADDPRMARPCRFHDDARLRRLSTVGA
jgi:hypothetical protein